MRPPSPGFDRAAARGLERGHDAEEKPGQQPDRGGERQDPRIEHRIEKNAAAPSRQEGHEKCGTPPREDQSNAGSKRDEDRSLGEHLADEPGPARTDGQADRDLVLAGRGAREQQVRNIGAADEQDQPDDRHHDRERLRQRPAHFIQPPGRRHEHDAIEVVVGDPIVDLVGLEHRVKIRARLLHRGAVLQPAHNAEPPGLCLAEIGAGETNRHSDVDGCTHGEATEARRCHADDGDPGRSDVHRLAEDGRTHARTGASRAHD